MAILDFLNIGMKIIDKIVPDPEQKAKAQFELMQLQQSGELAQLTADTQLATGQIETNKVEAVSEHIFISGWRPFIGWQCGIALGYHFVLQPFLAFVFASFNHPVTLPVFDMNTLDTILMGMLGLGSLRTVEKIKIGNK